MGYPDMRVPIAYALYHPERTELPIQPLDLPALATLSFEAPDLETFPCLALARAAGIAGGTAPCTLNAANEVAVHAFLGERLGFSQIATVIDATLERLGSAQIHSFETLTRADADARAVAGDMVELYSRA
jgi:1-deoxy-D-xylulose-5-phosphate reductoisomerase